MLQRFAHSANGMIAAKSPIGCTSPHAATRAALLSAHARAATAPGWTAIHYNFGPMRSADPIATAKVRWPAGAVDAQRFAVAERPPFASVGPICGRKSR
jgi:hypothetical protein